MKKLLACYLSLLAAQHAAKSGRITQVAGRVTRINAKAPEHPLMFAPGVALEINADGTLPEWIQLAPFGEWPTRDKTAVQRFNAESADQIISWFNFFPRRLARLAHLNAVKVWVGHPDFAPEEWPQRIDLGSVVELKADEHGLNGRIQWNAGAIDHVTEHKFPSVAWDCDVLGNGIEVPALLWSVGMWHRPNIKSVKAVINACLCELEEDPNKPTETETQSAMLKELKDALIKAGLIKPEDSDDVALAAIGSAIQAAVWKREDEARREKEAGEVRIALNAVADVGELPDESLTSTLVQRFNAANDQLAQLNQKLTDLETARAEARKARINTVISKAIELGLITKADEEASVTQLNADFDAGLAGLLSRKVQLNSGSLLKAIGGAKPGIAQSNDRISRINAWVDDYMAKHQCDRGTAWDASLQDDKMKAIHAEMAQADQARQGGGADA